MLTQIEIKERDLVFKIESDDNFNYIGSMANKDCSREFSFSGNVSLYFLLQQMELMMKLYPRRINRYILGKLNFLERLIGSKKFKLFGVDISKYLDKPIYYHHNVKKGDRNENANEK